MKIKYMLIFSILLSANYSYAQKIYQFSYFNSEFDFAKLTIGEGIFKLESFESMIKAKGDPNTYKFLKKRNGSYIATKIAINDFYGSSLFKYESTDSLLKIDTVYHPKDTLINGLSCKKVMISYVRGGLDGSGAVIDNTKYIPLDTLVSTLYVATIFNTITPFSFVSNKLNGLIIESKFPRTEYAVENEKVVKTIHENRIFTKMKVVYNLKEDFFKLPKSCIYHKSIKEFEEDVSKR